MVRAPEQAPSTMASSNRNRYLPTYIASISGTVVTATPQKNRLNPSCCSPATKLGPDEMPTTAMNTFRPTEFMNQTVDDGIRPKVGSHRTQPSEEKASNQYATGGGEREWHAADLVDKRTEQGADRDRPTNESHIRHVGHAIRKAQHLGSGCYVLGASDEGNDIAPLQLRIGHNRDIGCGRAADDPAQEHAARCWQMCQLCQRFSIDLLVGHIDIDTFDRHCQQFAIIDFIGADQ